VSTFARTAAGDLAQPRVLVTDPAQVALQWIVDALSLWQGEWFLNTDEGTPWLQKVFGTKNPSILQITKVLRQIILSAPYVIDVIASVQFNRVQRQFSYSFKAPLNTGETITGGSGQPFVVTGSTN
jgi:hypothetical protein